MESLKKNAQKAVKPKKADPPKKAVAKKTDAPKAQWVLQARQYLREVWHELRKVVWPGRKETLGSTAVVMVIVLLSGVFLGIVDFFLSRLVRMLIG